MSDYAHIVTDLVSAARTETDERKKDLVLRQISEVALHRDPSTIPLVLKDALDIAVGSSTSTVVFLVRFAGECLRQDYSQLQTVLASFSFLMTQESDRVHREVAAELTRGYSKAALAVADMIGAADANEAGLKHSWKQLRGVATKLVDKVSSNRASLQLRTAGVGLAESVVLFGLPAPQQKADPRRRRAAGPAADSSSVASLTSMHPFILELKGELEKEAEDVFSKLLLWAYQGGPQGSPFTPAQMALLAQAIASIAGQRHLRADGSDRDEPRSSKAARALQVLLTGKKSVCKDMVGADRKALVLAMHRFVGTSPPDPGSDLPKLREAIVELEALGFAEPADKQKDKKGTKRSRAYVAEEEEEAVAGAEDEASQAAEEALQSEARQALDEAETQLKRAKSEAALSATAAPSGVASAETELSADLAPELEDGAVSLSKVSQQKASARGTGIEYTIVPLAVSASQVAHLAAATLQRLLDSFYALKSEGAKATVSHAKMAVRTVLSQTTIQLCADEEVGEGSPSSQVIVPVFSLVPAEVDPALLAGVPMEVPLPRPVWQLLSFVLRTSSDDPATHVRARQASLLAAVRDKLDILVLLLKELRMQADADEEAGQGQDGHAASIYDNLVLVVMSRLLQNWNLREVTRPLFTALPRVPPVCVQVLKLLMHYGTKPSATAVTTTGGRPGKEIRQRGTRQEAMGLLGGLVAAVDESAGRSALHHLLWCAVSNDFEVRGKAVALLVNEVIHTGDWAYREITCFALQAAAQLVGRGGIAARADAVTEARELQWGALEKAAVAAAQKEMMKESAEADMELVGVGDVLMVVEEEEGGDVAPVQGMSLAAALEGYDSGGCFGGSFSTSLGLPTVGDSASTQAHAHRCVQLLAQVCASDPSLLGAFVDLTATLAANAELGTPEDVAAAAMETVASAKTTRDAAAAAAVSAAAAAGGGAADAAASEEATPLGAVTPRQRFDAVLLVLREDLANILPAVVVGHPTDTIFEALARGDPLGRPLLTYAMEVLHSDVYVPATPECIAAASGYLRASFGANFAEVEAKPKAMAVAATATEEGGAEVAAAAAAAAAAKEEAASAFLAQLGADELRFCLPLLGGFKRTAVEAALPKLLHLLMPTPDVLNRAISRLTLGQPPVMSKAQFLTYLHRMNEDDKSGQGLDKTQLKDAIGLCLDRDDFDGEVVREVLFNLVEDSRLSLYLMRTGILSARKYKDARKYLLQETVPKLIRRRVWTARDENSGKFPVWEGVVQCVRYFCDSKDSEQMLRCVLSLDGPRLAVVMKVAPKVPAILAKLLKTLSTKEREDVVSGRWAGIASERGKVDSEKKKIVESLQAMKL